MVRAGLIRKASRVLGGNCFGAAVQLLFLPGDRHDAIVGQPIQRAEVPHIPGSIVKAFQTKLGSQPGDVRQQ